jgi:hypothetical protein
VTNLVEGATGTGMMKLVAIMSALTLAACDASGEDIYSMRLERRLDDASTAEISKHLKAEDRGPFERWSQYQRRSSHAARTTVKDAIREQRYFEAKLQERIAELASTPAAQ